MRLRLDIMLNMLLEYVNKCTCIDYLKKSSNCLRVLGASLQKSAKAITSVDITERATGRDLYHLLGTGMEF